MTTSNPPAPTFLPVCPVQLPVREPRKSASVAYNYLSDKDPDNAEGYGAHELYPFPQGKKMKWLTQKEIVADLVSQGYDRDLAVWTHDSFERYTYARLHAYYMHKEQARRNEARRLARLKAEKLVGKQTPPAQEEG